MNSDTARLRRPASNRKRRNQPRAPSPSAAAPRRPLLLAVHAFVLAARASPGVQRISLLGSILTAKAIPKDVDMLVTIDAAMDLTRLARSGRRLMGQAQTINLGADIFLADTTGRYLCRICHYRECHPRVLCHAQRSDLTTSNSTGACACERACARGACPRALQCCHVPSAGGRSRNNF